MVGKSLTDKILVCFIKIYFINTFYSAAYADDL